MMGLWIGLGLLIAYGLWTLSVAYRCIRWERREHHRKMAPRLIVPKRGSYLP